MLLALPVAAGLLRPLWPLDETRYAAVAWEMWSRGDFLVPHLNGQPYHHKPPLLFWLVHAGWALFGVNDWWPRLVSPLCAAGALALTAVLARGLWPARPEVARMAPFILGASLMFWYFASALMFDALLTFFVVLGLVGLVRAWRGRRGGWLLFGLALGGALHAKGPVALVHLLPAALLAPWWVRDPPPRWGRWYGGALVALAGGAALILAWAVHAGLAGGDGYRRAIFWGQSAGRMVDSFAHREPWWFHLAALPLTLAPWLPWPRWWRGLRHGLQQGLMAESGLRLALLVAGVGLVFFSAISGKRLQYLLPEFPLFALIAARSLAGQAPRIERTVQRVALAASAAFAVAVLAAQAVLAERYDVRPVAARLAQFERQGRPVAVEGGHHGQWTFAGRLRQPLAEVDQADVPAWLAAHPGGRVVFNYRDAAEIPPAARVELDQRYRGGRLAILAPGP